MSKANGPRGGARKCSPKAAQSRSAQAGKQASNKGAGKGKKQALSLVLSPPKRSPAPAQWRAAFLRTLAATSNVSASAAEAGIPAHKAYQERRKNPEFAAEWHEALQEGYEHLEMEVLAYLRGNDPERKMDVANAIRLLAAHRDTVARMRAANEDHDEQAVLDSIDQMIDRMRRRNLAGSAQPAAKPGSANQQGGNDEQS